MWISQIELTNFKSYQHQVFNFPQPTGDRNIILIGGINGYGKTTILEAIYLGLYGPDAIIHLARAGLKGEIGYKSFLQKALHGHAIKNHRDTMSVLIQINVTHLEGFQILRKWYFKKNGDWEGEDALLYSVESGVRANPLKIQQVQELLDQHFVPAHLAPFFFFDGEEVKKLANQDRVEQIKQGMEGLLGVVLLRKLQQRLKQFQMNMRKDVPSVSEDKHRALFESLTKLEDDLESKKNKKSGIDQELDTLKIQRTELTERIMSLGGGGGDIATMKEIVTEQMNLRTSLDKCQDILDEILTSKLPFQLVSDDLIDTLKVQMIKEKNKIDWDNECSKLSPKKIKLLSKFMELESPTYKQPLSEDQLSTVTGRIEKAWESLFFPPPVGCTDVITHEYLSLDQRKKVLSLIEKVKIGADEIRTLISERERLLKKIHELDNKRARIEGLDRDGTLASLNNDLKNLSTSIESKQKDLGSVEREIIAITQTVNDTRATYEREHEKFIQANPVNSLIGKAERVNDLISDLIPQLYKIKTKHLADSMTDVYKSLAHKDIIDRIEISEDGASRILSKDGTEIPFDKSAGEDQLFATSLLAALASVSGIKAPLVVDTPLGRLDSKHRNNILSYWISDKNRQVILLSQDEEIDIARYEVLKPNVSKTYLLENQNIGGGVGKTFAKEDVYFGGISHE